MKAALLQHQVLRIGLPLLLLVVLLILPGAGLSEEMIRILFAAFVWIIAGIGWNIIGGFAGQVSFGFAVFYGLGAYTAALLINAGRGTWFAFVGAAAIAVLASFLIGLPTFRLRGPYFAIATIGVTEAVRVLMSNLSFTGGASGYRINETSPFSQANQYYGAALLMALAIAVSAVIAHSRFGLALRAIKQDQDAAASLGVNPFSFKLWAHAVGAALTGIAGALHAHYNIYIDPSGGPGGVFAFQTGISILLISVIGGIGTVWGPVLGGAVVGIVEEWITVRFSEIHLLLYGGLLIIIVLLEPDGLVGLLHRISKFFRSRREDSGGPGADKVLWGRSRLEGREL